MNKKIGILGCESKHAEFFGSLLNCGMAFPGYQAAYIFGDDAPDRLYYVQTTANIPYVCASVDELIEKSDAVLITYRLGERHVAPALACIKSGKPVFVDKPFTKEVSQAFAIVEASRIHNVVVQGGSTLTYDPKIGSLIEAARHASLVVIAYRAEITSRFGGYRFYGSHLTDLCASIFGVEALSVRSLCVDQSVSHQIKYPNRIVLLHSTPEFQKPQIILNNDDQLKIITLDDEGCYFNGLKGFLDSISRDCLDSEKMNQLIFSTHLLSAIMESLSSGEEIRL